MGSSIYSRWGIQYLFQMRCEASISADEESDIYSRWDLASIPDVLFSIYSRWGIASISADEEANIHSSFSCAEYLQCTMQIFIADTTSLVGRWSIYSTSCNRCRQECSLQILEASSADGVFGINSRGLASILD